MLDNTVFNQFQLPENDPYFSDPTIPVSEMGLKEKSRERPLISVMISTYNRYSQLRRTLVSLAHQTFRRFEVLLNDDGSSQDIISLFAEFSDYIKMSYFYTPRSSWVSCGSRAYRKMLPDAKGDVLAITHPEMILDERALQVTWDALERRRFTAFNAYVLDERPIDDKLYTSKDFIFPRKDQRCWVTLRSGFFDATTYPHIDATKWAGNAKMLRFTPNFHTTGGLASKPNSWHSAVPIYPWWFFGAARKDDPIWKQLPEYVGHASLDIWLIRYRQKVGMVDLVSREMLCYHQPHQVSAIAPKGEQGSIPDSISKVSE